MKEVNKVINNISSIYYDPKINLDFLSFNKILNKCSKLNDIHSIGFVVVNDLEKMRNDSEEIDKLFSYKDPERR